MARQRFIVLSNPVAGKEQAFIDWYVGRHIHDIVALEGVTDGQFFTATSPQAKWRHMGVYGVQTGKTPEILAEIGRRRGGEQMPMTDSIDGASIAFLTAEIVGEHQEPMAIGDAPFRFVAISANSDEAEFDRWYGDVHVPEVLSDPGFLAAERLRLTEHKRGGLPEWSRVGLYWVRDEGAARRMGERSASGEMQVSPVLDLSTRYAGLYRAQSERIGI